MTDQEMIALAESLGFAAAGVVGTEEIVFDPSFRPYCEENLCGKYGVNYACPPACGTPEEMKQRVLAHKKALVLQTIWDIADFSDNAAIKQAKGHHNKISIQLMKQLRENGVPGFFAGSGGCSLCTECALVRGEPCVFPDLQYRWDLPIPRTRAFTARIRSYYTKSEEKSKGGVGMDEKMSARRSN